MRSKSNYKSAQVYLERIVEHVEKLEVYKARVDYDEFKRQEEAYDAICMQLSQIGECVSKIEKSADRIIESFPHSINWKALKGLRNRIDHDYTWLEVDKIWKMLEENILELREGVKEILNKRYGV